MSYDGLICSSCGSRQIVKRDGLFACEYCGSNVAPRLVAGALCDDLEKGAVCGALAESLCTACGRPLCRIHNDPKIVYWQTPLEWRRLCPEWDDAAGMEWDKLVNPAIRLPIAGFDPFPWKDHGHEGLLAIGEMELEIAEKVKGIVNQLGGDYYETGVKFKSICSNCEAGIRGEVDKAVSAYGPRYRKAAYEERILSIEANLEQGIAYVEAFLKGPIPPGAGQSPTYLHTESPIEEWENFGSHLKQLLNAANRLTGMLKGPD